METAEIIKLNDDHELHIVYESDPDSPRNWDNLGTMICVHSRYNLGDVHYKSKLEGLKHIAVSLGITKIINDLDMYEEVYEDEEQLQDWINSREDFVMLPLYLYDHGGITMSTSAFSCRWDSGQVGYIYCSTDKILKEYGNTNIDTLSKVESNLKSEVKTYDQYLTGDVYGFKLYKVETCDKGHKHLDFLNSCYGFYGYDWTENGIFDHISNELIPEEYAKRDLQSH